MKLLRGLKHIPAFQNGTVSTVGNFDGVHLGHQALLKHLKAKSRELNLPLVVLLFEPQPNEFFYPENPPARLSTLRDKLKVLKQCEVDYVVCLSFNKKLANMDSMVFMDYYLFSVLHSQYLLVGEDFCFGKNRSGNVALLQEWARTLAIETETFTDFVIFNQRISSTKIREMLIKSDFLQTALWLGRPYSICRRVIHGNKRATDWGFPTANLAMSQLSVPLMGVFCVQIKLHGLTFEGVANLGCRPTIDGRKIILEIHLFNFEGSLYGEMLEVFFLHKLREEKKFSSVEALIEQIKQDIATAKEQFLLRRLEFNTILGSVTH